MDSNLVDLTRSDTDNTTGLANITSVLREERVFPPPPDFAQRAHLKSLAEYRKLYQLSIRSPAQFWEWQAKRELSWFKPWTQVLEWREPFARWFTGGQLNASYNCLDRHLDSATANQAAIIWEGEPADSNHPGEERVLTYRQLHREVCRFANVLRRSGVEKGDRVLIYLPLVPEAAVSMLACARIGAIHSVVFAGFSAQSVAERIADSQAKLVITADGGFRRGAIVPLKKNVDEALAFQDEQGNVLARGVEKVIVLRRVGHDVSMTEGRDWWWHDLMATADSNCPAEPMDSEHPLFILYTSGSTGKPKGVLHTTAGYLLGVKVTSKFVFDLKPTDVFWCTADVGWVTGHSYVVYGPLANGATTLMYEGAPNYPEPDRFWRIVEKYGVTILYTAPTAIRAFMKWGAEWPRRHDLRSLRLLGSVGEPINPEAWMWYHEVIGQRRCPIVDTWWQTETGAIMISPLPGLTPTKPGSVALPFFGIVPDVVDANGQTVPLDKGGKLVIRQPWPSMMRGIWGDPHRYQSTYWNEVPGCYFTGDGCRRDKDGYFWVVGRIDDVLNVAGHRLGTAEVESALVSHPYVAEAAVVGRTDDLKGQALVAFVTLRNGCLPDDDLREELRQHVGKVIGPVAKPDDIRFAEALPKTRSGKLMRRLLKQIAAGTTIQGDITTLEDITVLAKLTHEDE